MRGELVKQRESQPHAVQRGPERELDIIDDEGPRHGHGDRPAALFENDEEYAAASGQQ